jgi:hypothetical protein
MPDAYWESPLLRTSAAILAAHLVDGDAFKPRQHGRRVEPQTPTVDETSNSKAGCVPVRQGGSAFAACFSLSCSHVCPVDGNRGLWMGSNYLLHLTFKTTQDKREVPDDALGKLSWRPKPPIGGMMSPFTNLQSRTEVRMYITALRLRHRPDGGQASAIRGAIYGSGIYTTQSLKSSVRQCRRFLWGSRIAPIPAPVIVACGCTVLAEGWRVLDVNHKLLVVPRVT